MPDTQTTQLSSNSIIICQYCHGTGYARNFNYFVHCINCAGSGVRCIVRKNPEDELDITGAYKDA